MIHKKRHFVLRCSGWESRGETVFVQCLMGVSIVGMFVVQEREEANGGVQKESSLLGILNFNTFVPITDFPPGFRYICYLVNTCKILLHIWVVG